MSQQPWERYELDFLAEVAGTMTLKEVAEKLERTQGSVKNKAMYLGITLFSAKGWQSWTPEHTALFNSHTDKEISLITGRSPRAVATKRYNLRIHARAA